MFIGLFTGWIMSCSRCGGAKEVNGIGNMPVKCSVCNGTGKEVVKLKVDDVMDKVVTALSVDAPKVVVKRKRKVVSK
jgi:DnaJ-class molecular chaperone